MKIRPFHRATAILGAALLASCGHAKAATLVSNGPVVGDGGLSVIRAGAGTFGFGAQANIPNLVADDFVVPVGDSWNITDISFYSYQTGAAGTFTLNTATWSIVAGSITGPVVTSGTTAVTNAGLVGYRVISTSLGDTSRAIFEANADIPDFSLSAGTYFIRWGLTGTLASGPWAPPTADGVIGNARQSQNNGPFASIVDSDGLGVSLPFTINGTSAIPEPGSVLGLGCLLSAALVLRTRRASRVIA